MTETMEAYVTPAGSDRVGIAFLWDRDRLEPGTRASFDDFLVRFPALAAKISGAEPDSSPRGAGPFLRRARSCIADRFVLLGDAAGYVDAITGEGISLALEQAAYLGRIVPDALARGAGRQTLVAYERALSKSFAKYALVARSVLAVARRPALRRRVVPWLAAHPRAFEHRVALASA